MGIKNEKSFEEYIDWWSSLPNNSACKICELPLLTEEEFRLLKEE